MVLRGSATPEWRHRGWWWCCERRGIVEGLSASVQSGGSIAARHGLGRGSSPGAPAWGRQCVESDWWLRAPTPPTWGGESLVLMHPSWLAVRGRHQQGNCPSFHEKPVPHALLDAARGHPPSSAHWLAGFPLRGAGRFCHGHGFVQCQEGIAHLALAATYLTSPPDKEPYSDGAATDGGELTPSAPGAPHRYSTREDRLKWISDCLK